MSKNNLSKVMKIVLVSFSASIITGCTDKEAAFDTEALKKELAPFDFKTSEKTQLVLNVGPQAAEEVLAIYPTEVDSATAKLHTDMLFSAFADKNGSLETDIDIPTNVKKVWIVSPTKPSLGVMTAEVQNGKLVLNAKQNAKNMRRAATSTTVDANGNITTVQEDGSSLTLFNLDNYVTVHEGTISEEDQARGYKTLSTVSKKDMGHFYCIDQWMPTYGVVNGQYEDVYHYGRTGNVNNLKSVHQTIKDHAIEMARNQKLWVNENKAHFSLLEAKDINEVMEGETVVVKNADGSTTTTSYDGSELWITFISESASYQNTFGYYIYKNDAEPTTVDAGNRLDRIILFPSASVDVAIDINSADMKTAKGNPYSRGARQKIGDYGKSNTIWNNDAPLRAGDRIQLLFKDPETGAISKRFPKGYTVGFWFVADAYDPGWNIKDKAAYGINLEEEANGGYKSKIVLTQSNSRYLPWRNGNANTNFCNTNPKATNSSLFKGITTRYVNNSQNLYGEEFHVFSVEDGSDAMFNDILFALERADYKSVTNSNSNLKLHQEDYHTVATYAFEDRWPDGYDFDLNDVIVEHEQSQTYKSDNTLYSVSDRFRLVSKLDAANQRNAFYVQFPEGEEGDVSKLKVTVNGIEAENRWEAETNSVIVFTDQRAAIASGKTEVIVTRDLSAKSFSVGDLSYRPYLIANAATADGTTLTGSGRCEIHIPGDPITSLGKTLELSGSIDINYYASQFVSSDNQYPFAISLSNVAGWIAPEPGIRIDKTFKNYASWRQSKGFKNQDWYYNKKGYDYRYANGYYDSSATPWN